MSLYTEIAEEIGQIVTKKNEAYGSSFAKAGEFLKLLYPHGLSVDEFETALLLVRIFDKQMRLATDADAFGESPFSDIAGYGILGVSLHHARKEAEADPSAGHDPLHVERAVRTWLVRQQQGYCGSCCTGFASPSYKHKLVLKLPSGTHAVQPCSPKCHKDMTERAVTWGSAVEKLYGGLQ